MSPTGATPRWPSPRDVAWRLLTGADVADTAVELRGELTIAGPFLSARSIIV